MSFQNAKIGTAGTNPRDYHGQVIRHRGDKDYWASPSMLREFDTCASRWRAGYSGPDSDAKDYGNVLDCMVTTPGAFDKFYAVQPETYAAPATHAKVKKGEINFGDPLPWNANASVCQEWEELQGGREIISNKIHSAAVTALTVLNCDDFISNLLIISAFQVQVNAEWVDKATGLSIPVRCLIDMVPDVGSVRFGNCLADLKSARSAHPAAWPKHCFELGYHVQAAMNLDMYSAATGEDRNTFLHVVSENYPPFQPARSMMSAELVELGRAKYRRCLAKYAQCLATDQWPGYEAGQQVIDGFTLCEPPRWAALQEAASNGNSLDNLPPFVPSEQFLSETPT